MRGRCKSPHFEVLTQRNVSATVKGVRCKSPHFEVLTQRKWKMKNIFTAVNHLISRY